MNFIQDRDPGDETSTPEVMTGVDVVSVLQRLDTATLDELTRALNHLYDHFPETTEALAEAKDTLCLQLECAIAAREPDEDEDDTSGSLDEAIQEEMKRLAQSAYEGGYEAGYADALQGLNPIFPLTDEAADTVPVNGEALGLVMVIRTGVEANVPIEQFVPGMALILRQGLAQLAHSLSGKPVGTVDGVSFLGDVIQIQAEILPEGNFRGISDGMQDADSTEMRQAA